MCLLIVKRAGAPVAELLDELQDISESNGDGFGIAWADGAKIRTRRGLKSLDEQRELIKAVEPYNAIIHWRMATSGRINPDNCHPFRLKDGTVFAHNGVIFDKRVIPTNAFSDTAILSQMSPTYDALVKNCQELDSGTSRFAIMPRDGSIEILNEEAGKWNGDVWYSNFNYRTWSYCGMPDWHTSKGEKSKSYVQAYYDDLNADLDLLIDQYGYRAVQEALDQWPCPKYDPAG